LGEPALSPTADQGSFRDWDARVFAEDDRVLRALTSAGLSDWEALSGSKLFATYTSDGRLVETVRTDDAQLTAVQRADPAGGWVAVLDHERIAFVSYPYEWSFSMLQDAALLQLELTTAALAEGLALKDATPYNVQWRGACPVFVDVASFERARSGEPWAGYRQFCMLFLYPLLLEAYRGVPFRPWLRGSVDGISPRDFRALFGRRDAFRPGMLKHVFLHAGLERRYAARGSSEVREDLQEAGFGDALVAANVRQLTKLVTRLRSPRHGSAWRDYHATCTYEDEDAAAKEGFVRRIVAGRRRTLVWDLGCNDGRHARIASENAHTTVAIDFDDQVVDDLYRALRDEGNRSILPLVVDLADPSPSLGWRNAERATLGARGRPDLVLALALVHHLSITHNVPLREIVDWLRNLDCEVVVELPHRDDPMVQRLLQHKRAEAHPDYELATFDALLRERFEVVDSLRLASGRRTLFRVRPA
jgi:SAM-dependent methyltransferase